MIRAWARFLALILAIALAAPAAAHLTPNSEIRLRFEPGAVRADVLIPVAEFAYATGSAPADLGALRRYLTARTGATAPDGRRWTVSIDHLRIESAPGGPDILGTITYAPPPGAPDRQLTLLWDAVIRESDAHYALVGVSGDLASGVSEEEELVGSFTAGNRALAIDRGAIGRSALFAGAMRLGARHILEGHDHLLFLLTLMLPAPLLARRGRWDAVKQLRATLRQLAWIVTAFTVGHSITLILAALFDARLPTGPVEAIIAMSVLIGAIHAMRPLFAGREPWVAFGFGLIHGLAFATVVAGFGATLSSRGVAIAGFNLGIEAVQLAIVLLLLPALAIGARTRWYRPARLTLAGFAAVAAVVWLTERVSGLTTSAGTQLGAIMPPLGLALVALSLVLAVQAVARNRRAASSQA